MKIYLHDILNENNITDPAQLQEIHLVSKELDDLSFLSPAINIRVLNIVNNKISDLSFLKKCFKLVSFNADHNYIQNISMLMQMDQLEEMSLSYNPIQLDELKRLGKLKKLRRLTVQFTPIMERKTAYSQLISFFPFISFLNGEKVRETNGELADLNRFIDTLPVSQNEVEVKQEEWLPGAAFDVVELPGFAEIIGELEYALYESQKK